MKLDNKQKYERIRRFLSDIKLQPNIEPFLFTQDIPKFGIYDFCYITKNPNSFAKIQKKLKDSKYDELQQFTQDLKQVFIAVSDYAFQDEPIQQVVDHFIKEIDWFAQRFTQDFKANPVRPRPQLQLPTKKEKTEQPKPVRVATVVQQSIPKERASNLLQKLQMIFLLRGNENNEPYIRSIGSAYGIGAEVGDEYVITLDDRNSSWTQFLSKRD